MRSLIVLPWVLVACGGSIGPIDPTTLKIEGSYDFVVGGVSVTPSSQQPQEPTTDHPAIGQHARLDIHKQGSTYVAAITPEFSDPQAMTVSFGSDGTLTLQGAVSFSGGSLSYATTTDELDTISFPIGGDGHLEGSFVATGKENIFEGDVGSMNDASMSGNTAADARVPQSLASVVPYAQTVVLPWDEIDVRMSEPVDANTLMQSASLSPSNGGTASVAWSVSSSAIDWLGATSLTGYRTSWSDFSGQATLAIAAGLTDPSGNLSAVTATPVQYIDVPNGGSFGGATPPAMWGAAQIATGSDSCGTASSCIEIGPITGPCSASPGGIAGRFVTNGTNKVSLVYRMRVASQYGQPYLPGGLGVSVATPGQPAQSIADPNLQPQLAATSDATYPYASDWTTATITLPQSGSDVGFAVVPFASGQMYCDGGGPAWMPMTIVVDVASISAL